MGHDFVLAVANELQKGLEANEQGERRFAIRTFRFDRPLRRFAPDVPFMQQQCFDAAPSPTMARASHINLNASVELKSERKNSATPGAVGAPSSPHAATSRRKHSRGFFGVRLSLSRLKSSCRFEPANDGLEPIAGQLK